MSDRLHRRWDHQHLVCAVEGGVAIEDIVDYQLPLGALGRHLNRRPRKRLGYRTPEECYAT